MSNSPLVKERKFLYSVHWESNKSSLIFCECKQFPIVLAHATTIHKTHGSTIDHMTGDLDSAPKCGKRLCPI